jgi:hypothetical protein
MFDFTCFITYTLPDRDNYTYRRVKMKTSIAVLAMLTALLAAITSTAFTTNAYAQEAQPSATPAATPEDLSVETFFDNLQAHA